MIVRLHRRNKLYLIECPDGSTIKHFNHIVADDCLMLPGWKWGCDPRTVISMARRKQFGLRLVGVEPASPPAS